MSNNNNYLNAWDSELGLHCHLYNYLKNTSNKWLQPDTEAAYSLPNNYGKDDIDYTFNSYGFRSDEFQPSDAPVRILFAGCSFTKGVGLPLADVYAHRVVKMLEQDHGPLPYWNVAIGGGSGDCIARLTTLAMQKVNPTHVVVVWPTLSRREVIHEGRCSSFLVNFNRFGPNFLKAAMTYYTPEQEIYRFHANLTAIKNITKDIKFYWSSWDIDAINSPIPKDLAFHKLDFFLGKVDDDDLARDKGHFGSKGHKIFADKLYEVIKND